MRHFIRNTTTLATLMLLWCGSALPAQQGNSVEAQLSNTDMAFVQSAILHNHLHTSLAKKAMDHASQEKVREFAKQMAADHTKFNKELLALTAEKGIVVPTAEPNKTVQALVEKYSDLKGAAFDRQYLRQTVVEMGQAVTNLNGEAKAGEADYLRKYAAKALPVYREHLQTAEKLEKELKEQK
jgi:putative membrane protein